MFGEKYLTHGGGGGGGGEGETSKPKIKDNPDDPLSFSPKVFLKHSNMGFDGSFHSTTTPKPNQELTLSYLCENSSKLLGFPEKDFSGNILMEKLSLKGKEVALPEISNSNQDQWVERDFLNLNEKRVSLDEDFSREKKTKLETLDLSLALPDVSLSLTSASNVVKPKPSISTNTATTFSNDFTTYSYSHSHQISHNPSCSMTGNSTDFGSDTNKLWCGGEGTNGSVHSRFRPLGDGLVALNNNPSMIQGKINTNKDNSSLYNNNNKTTSSDNISFFPSELPARPVPDNNNISSDSRKREGESLNGFECGNVGRVSKISSLERILKEILSESVPIVSQIFQELSDEIFESVKEYLRSIISNPESREEFVTLQNRLERRADLTRETLSKCHRGHLEILVSIKTGLESFLSGKNRLSGSELVEIFLFMRCRNVNCRSLLPVDDCDCKICTANKGFCSSCMCPVCLNFDCASNTCTWVGCDVCSHWCHAVCGIQKNLIKPGQSLKGPSGTSEMQFHCIACGHSSEMFGFVKDVFMHCAKDWGLETLKKELDCVRKIFKGSDDVKGKELRIKADMFLSKLERNMMSTSDACKLILSFFDYLDSMPISAPSKPMPTQAAPPVSQPAFLPPKYSVYNTSSSTGRPESLSNNPRQNDLTLFGGGSKINESSQFGKITKKEINSLDSLESLVRIKDAEARMFQNKADQARREAESLLKMIRLKSDQLEEEYTVKVSKLSLDDAEERRRKKLDELKVLENSHCDYYNMKLRMQSDIAGLMERMKTTKQQV